MVRNRLWDIRRVRPWDILIANPWLRTEAVPRSGALDGGISPPVLRSQGHRRWAPPPFMAQPKHSAVLTRRSRRIWRPGPLRSGTLIWCVSRMGRLLLRHHFDLGDALELRI